MRTLISGLVLAAMIAAGTGWFAWAKPAHEPLCPGVSCGDNTVLVEPCVPPMPIIRACRKVRLGKDGTPRLARGCTIVFLSGS